VRGACRIDAQFEVDRVHLGQHLPGAHAIALVDEHTQHPAGGGRAKGVRATRLDRADAEDRRRERRRLGPGDGHAHRRHRPLSGDDPGKARKHSQRGRNDDPFAGRQILHLRAPQNP
jgi:hypothetical protein